MDPGQGKNYDEIAVGDELPRWELKIGEDVYSGYNKLVGEINPLHFDRKFARKLGFRDIVVAGVYTYSFIPKMVEEHVGDNGRIRKISIKYHAPVYINETIVQEASVIRKKEDEAGKSIEIEVNVSDTTGKKLTGAVVSVVFA